MRASWTAMQTFLNCQRKYDLSYVHNLAAKTGTNRYNLILGDVFHAAIEAHLSGNDVMNAINIAIANNSPENVRVYDYEQKMWVTDLAFYRMIDEIKQLAIRMSEFYLPQLGDRYQVAHTSDLGLYAGLMLEWEFDYGIGDGDSLSGRIDAVMYDTELDEYVIVDWKTRENFPKDEDALIDGQLHLYAGVLNSILAGIGSDIYISRVIMWQFRTQLPKPAEIGKNNDILTGRKGYDTTFDYWASTLPADVDAEKYRSIMEPKMKRMGDYMRLVEGVVTPTSDALSLQNAVDAIEAMKTAVKEGKFPAVLGSWACKFCDFQRLCINTLRYGGDPTEILELYYEDRKELDKTEETE